MDSRWFSCKDYAVKFDLKLREFVHDKLKSRELKVIVERAAKIPA